MTSRFARRAIARDGERGRSRGNRRRARRGTPASAGRRAWTPRRRRAGARPRARTTCGAPTRGDWRVLKKLLVANRGEIALRVMRTASEMGLATVAVYSEPDRDALHVASPTKRICSDRRRPSQSYLNVDEILDVAARARRRRDASRLRVSRRERGLRARGRSSRPDVGRPAPGRDRRDGRQGSRAPSDGGGRRAGRARRDAKRSSPSRTRARGRTNTACRSHSKPRAAAAARASKSRARWTKSTARVHDGAREAEAYFKNRHDLCRTLSRQSQTRRAADPGGQARQRRSRRRTRLLVAAAPSKTLGRNAGARSPKTCANGLREAGIRAAKAIGYDSVGTIERSLRATSSTSSR